MCSIGCFVESAAKRVRAAIRSSSRDLPVTFDPSIRPALVGGHASALQVTEEIASCSGVVKLSDEGATWLYPGAFADELLGRLLTLGARVVALTYDGDAACIACTEARVTLAPRTVRVQDTVGAGDTFMAALIATLAEHRLHRDDESLTLAGEGSAAAAVTVGRIGEDLPTRIDLDAAFVAPTV